MNEAAPVARKPKDGPADKDRRFVAQSPEVVLVVVVVVVGTGSSSCWSPGAAQPNP